MEENKKKVTLLLDEQTANMLEILAKEHFTSQGGYLRRVLTDPRREDDVLLYKMCTLEDHMEAIGAVVAWWHQQPEVYRYEGAWYAFMEMVYDLLTCSYVQIDDEEMKNWNHYFQSNIYTLKMSEADKYAEMCKEGTFTKEALLEFFGFLHAHTCETVFKSIYIPRIFEIVFSRCGSWIGNSDDQWHSIQGRLIKHMQAIGYCRF